MRVKHLWLNLTFVLSTRSYAYLSIDCFHQSFICLQAAGSAIAANSIHQSDFGASLFHTAQTSNWYYTRLELKPSLVQPVYESLAQACRGVHTAIEFKIVLEKRSDGLTKANGGH
jgi:hypothetical protein